VLSGTFNFQLGDCLKSAPAGSFVFIPKDEAYPFQHVGPEPGVLRGGVTPAGFEGIFSDRAGANAEAVRALFNKGANWTQAHLANGRMQITFDAVFIIKEKLPGWEELQMERQLSGLESIVR
jgi:hypothetical protein